MVDYKGIKYKDGDLVRYEPHDEMVSSLAGYVIWCDRTRHGIRYIIAVEGDVKNNAYQVYDYKGKITLISPASKNFPDKNGKIK